MENRANGEYSVNDLDKLYETGKIPALFNKLLKIKIVPYSVLSILKRWIEDNYTEIVDCTVSKKNTEKTYFCKGFLITIDGSGDNITIKIKKSKRWIGI